MASEQTRTRKKQTRSSTKGDHCHPVLYRHQDCFPPEKLLQGNENQNLLGVKNSKDRECCKKPNIDQEFSNVIPAAKQTNNHNCKRNEILEKDLQAEKLRSQLPNSTLSNNEEQSKSRKRRLRKRRLLVSLTPASSDNNPISQLDNNVQTKFVSQQVAESKRVTTPCISTIKSSEQIKPSSKDPRKRLDKSVGTRNKNIKSKPVLDQQTQQSKVDLIKSLEEKTLNSLLQTLVPRTNASPKVRKAPLPVFSFPEKRLSSSAVKVNGDDVFYFGETKHQLEKLSLDSNKCCFNTSSEKSELTHKKEPNGNDFSAVTFNNSVGPLSFSHTSNGNNKFDFGSFSSSNQVHPFLNDIQNKKEYSDCSTSEHQLKLSPDQHLGLVQKTDINYLSLFKNSPGASQITSEDICLFDNSTKSIEDSKDFSIAQKPEPESKLSQSPLVESLSISLGAIMKPAEGMHKDNKTREEILLDREAKKAAKLAARGKSKTEVINQSGDPNNGSQKIDRISTTNDKPLIYNTKLNAESTNNVKSDEGLVTTKIEESSAVKSKAELKAERRAKQEAQRAAKASNKSVQLQAKEKVVPATKKELKSDILGEIEKKSEAARVPSQPRPKLFSHLYKEKLPVLSTKNSLVRSLHPAILRLGVQYSKRVVVGSNARCVALLHALKQMVNDYTTPAEKEFSRGLEEELGPITVYLNQCRPLAVSMTNALRHIKRTLTQLPNSIPDVEARRKICEVIDTYIHEQIDVAGKAICNRVIEKIADGDVILTYGCSSLVYQILVESHTQGTKFRVVIVDGLPWREGREMLRRLIDKGLSCTYVLITAASFIMREASKVLLGAHALLANGYVLSRAGSSQVALLAHCNNVPVLVCCETHKFCERVQTDAFVYNEIGELSCDNTKIKDKSRVIERLTPLSLAYDITPPDLVSAVVTELAVLPCTSVPVILRIKPSESIM